MGRGYADFTERVGYSKVGTFSKAIASAGTAEALSAASVPCKMVMLSADLGNTNPVVIGDANVVAASGSQQGVVLVPGNDPVTLYIDNLNKLYADVQTNGDRICGAYFF